MAYDSSGDHFLKIEGIEGECKRTGLEGWIEMENYSFGAHQTASGGFGGGQSGAARVSFQDITIAKRMEKSSPKLTQAMFKGHVFDKATIVSRRTGLKDGKPVRYLVWELENVLVSGHSFGGSSSGEIPTESVTLRFESEKMHYREVIEGQPQGPVSAGWNVKKNTEA